MKGYGKAACRNKKCGAQWESLTQLRKERKQGSKAECPKCKEPLTKNQALGGRRG